MTGLTAGCLGLFTAVASSAIGLLYGIAALTSQHRHGEPLPYLAVFMAFLVVESLAGIVAGALVAWYAMEREELSYPPRIAAAGFAAVTLATWALILVFGLAGLMIPAIVYAIAATALVAAVARRDFRRGFR